MTGALSRSTPALGTDDDEGDVEGDVAADDDGDEEAASDGDGIKEESVGGSFGGAIVDGVSDEKGEVGVWIWSG